MMITIQLPDGTYAQKPIDALQPDDMIVFGGRETPPVEYKPQPMDWDFALRLWQNPRKAMQSD